MDDQFLRLVKWTTRAASLILVTLMMIGAGVSYFHFFYQPNHRSSEIAVQEVENVKSVDLTEVKDGIHIPTGLVADVDLNLVITNCTACHSSKLIIQNRATADGWRSLIRWMQSTQNLWNLGENEEKIVAYLAKNYPPVGQGRRKPLENIEWYELE